MKVLKQILFAAAVMICFSITASAQKQDDKKPPEKKNPPVIQLVPKNDGKNKPKEEDKPKNDKKKPESFYLFSANRSEIEFI